MTDSLIAALLSRGTQRRRATLVVVAGTGACALSSLAALAQGIATENEPLTSAAATIFSTFAVLFVILLGIVQLLREPTARDLQAIRTERFRQVVERTKLSMDLHLHPRSKRTRMLQQSVFMYRPNARHVARSEKERRAVAESIQFIAAPEDNALWIQIVDGKSSASVPLATISCWQPGDQLRLGIFLHHELLSTIPSSENAELLCERIRSLFFGETVRRAGRHDHVLIEKIYEHEQAVADPIFWDGVAAETAHVTVHTCLEIFGLRSIAP